MRFRSIHGATCSASDSSTWAKGRFISFDFETWKAKPLVFRGDELTLPEGPRYEARKPKKSEPAAK